MLRALVRRVSFLLTLVAGMAMFTGTVHAKSLDDILKDGVIRIGINPNFPPNSSRNADGEWEGALTRNSERAKLIEYTVPLHTEVLAALTTEDVAAETWQDLNTDDITLANIRSSWVIDWQKQNMSNAKQEIVDTIPDVVRLVAQGRADAIVENIDFFMSHTKNHPNVNWKVLEDPIFVGYCAIGVSKNNYGLRDVLNIILYNLHSSDTVNDTWEKWYGAPMLVEVVPNPYF